MVLLIMTVFIMMIVIIKLSPQEKYIFSFWDLNDCIELSFYFTPLTPIM